MRHLNCSAPLWAVLALCASAPSRSQAPASPAHAAPPSYSAESIVIRHAEIIMDMKADGTGTRDETTAATIQSEAALRQLGVIGINFASASERVEFRYVRVRHADGSVTETPLDGVQEQAAPITREAPFYSDLKQKQLPVKGLHVGDTIEWQTHSDRFKAEAPNQFWGNFGFVRDAVILEQHSELRIPAASHVTVWTNPASGIKPSETTTGGQHIYIWDWKQLDPTAGPAAEAGAKAKKKKPLTPEEAVDGEEGRLPDVAWTTFPNWGAVGAWYRSLEADRNIPDEAIKAKVAEITAGKTTQEDKAKAVYAWVSGQIRYIGVAFGVGRYQPHAASAVLDNQYGDCKDKHTLLAAMLNAIGLHPDAVLLGAGIRFNDAVPSPASFNHLITRVQIDGKPIWLDSTAEVAPYRLLPPLDRDKQVLVIPSEGPAAIARTTSDYPYAPYSTLTAVGSLDKDLTGDSKFVLTYRDDDEIILRSVLRQVSPAQYSEFVQRIMARMGFGGTTNEAEIDHADDPSQPLVISFHYHRVKEPTWGENRITAAFEFMPLPAVDEKDPPIAPIALGIPRTETSTLEIKLPEGWSAELPEAVHAVSPYAKVDVTYKLDKGVLHAERRLTVLKEKVPAAEWKPYKAWYDEAGADGVPFIQLTHGTGHRSSSASNPAISNAEAAKLVSKAWDELQHNQVDAAETDLLGAQQLNPNQEALWGDLGLVALRRGNHIEAMRDYKKEIELHPESTFAWQTLAQLQNTTGDRKAAIETLKKWTAYASDSTAPVTQLIALLLSASDASGAIKAGNDALKNLSAESQADPGFQLVLGEAQLRSGATDAGVATLSALAKDQKNMGIRNDAAYELAKAHQQLPLAEATERAVLEQIAAQTRSWTGDESVNTLRNGTGLIAAAWDTLGWLLFSENKTTEAEAYIHASWLINQHREVGEHLGDIHMAQNHPAEALRDYRLAAATVPLYDAMGVRTKPGSNPEVAALDAKIAKAKSAAGKDETFNNNEALKAIRTIPLGPPGGLDGTAEYRLLLSPHGIERIDPGDGAELHGGEARIRAAKLPSFFPPDTDARLVRIAFLNCHSGTCEIIFGP
jgi:tetratricopeptide (TPR) repeat protein